MNNYIVDLYKFLSAEMERPKAFGPFHLISFAIVVAVAVLLCIFFRNCSDRTMRIILLVIWVIMVVFELLEQFVIGTSIGEDGILHYDIHWYRFPFQLCSTALWITPLILLIPEGGIRDALIGYMTLFSFFGGLIVMITIGDVYTEHVITNIHTMIHHGLQVVLGVFFISHERHKYNMRYYVGGVLCFLVLLSIACVMNEVMHEVLLAYGRDDSFNMFYVSPYFPCTLPVVSIFYGDVANPLVPYPVFLLMYCFGFIIISFIIYFVASLINHVTDYIRHREDYPDGLK